MEIERGSMLTGHPLEEKERVVGQFMVMVTGVPTGSIGEIQDAITKMVAKSVIDNRSELGKLVASLHTVVGVFDPREYFGAE
jgi:hypothetical protein